jgi:hypothetical protein
MADNTQKKPSITSIWNNDFYNAPPIPKWSWELSFDYIVYGDDEKTEEFNSILNKAAVSCQWGARTGNVIPIYYAGIEARLLGRTQTCGELTIKFNENTNMLVTKVLEELFHAEVTCDSYFTNQEGYAFNKNFNKINRTITLKIHKPAYNMAHNSNSSNYTKEVLCEIVYHNCIMYKIDQNELSYEDEDGVITHTATFSYDYMTVKGNPPAGISINDTCKVHMG